MGGLVLAQEPASTASSARTVDSVPAPPAVGRARVELIVIGEVAADFDLSAALGPNLRAEYELRFMTARRFDPQELFRARFDSTIDVHVWIDATDPKLGRLYFAEHTGTRFLVRALELSGEMDEMDREVLAQAIEWSLRALTDRSTETLTRAEAEALVGGGDRTEPTIATPTTTKPRAGSRPAPRVSGRFGSFYGLGAHSNEIPIVHGPGLRLGLEAPLGQQRLAMMLGGQYQIPQRCSDGRLELELHALVLRAALRLLGPELGAGLRMGPYLGVGADAVFASVEVLDPTAVTAHETGTERTFVATGGLAMGLDLWSRLRPALELGVELDPVELHFDVETPDGPEPFVEHWRVRPVVSLGVELP